MQTHVQNVSGWFCCRVNAGKRGEIYTESGYIVPKVLRRIYEIVANRQLAAAGSPALPP